MNRAFTYIYVITNNEYNKADQCKIGRHTGSKDKLISAYGRGCTPTVHLFERALPEDEKNLKDIFYDLRQVRKRKLEWIKCDTGIVTGYIREYLLRYGEETYSYYSSLGIRGELDKILKGADSKKIDGRQIPFEFMRRHKIYDKRRLLEWYKRGIREKKTTNSGSDRESDEDYFPDELSLDSSGDSTFFLNLNFLRTKFNNDQSRS